ncbi:hypothetical protein [Leifsonia naganoensis]|uniref:Uncharacterized protein n=1 Tax=Leifsonia naganoensis TaxID=150025 RepID=A0A853DMF9_9MICO|nr:hypothetical protein [Leifsonia naganoensis]NYK09467.1 hypothetical protein [Leifsonia naganoensis]
MSDSHPELESIVSEIEREFADWVHVARVPLIDGAGYVVRFTPANPGAAVVTVDHSLGVYTIDAATSTFDGYDGVGRGSEWALAIVQGIGRRGMRVERVTRFGLPWGRATLLGVDPPNASIDARFSSPGCRGCRTLLWPLMNEPRIKWLAFKHVHDIDTRVGFWDLLMRRSMAVKKWLRLALGGLVFVVVVGVVYGVLSR